MRVVLLLLMLLAGCGSEVPLDLDLVALSAPEQVVPSAALPAEVVTQAANNNLDVTLHDGRLYLAFRTAPSHFASTQTVLYVVASDDGGASWTYEASFARDTDLREPRLLSWGSRLFLYFAVLGADLLAFEPQGALATERTGPGAWTEPVPLYLPGFIPWRARVVDGVPYLIGYLGGANIYEDTRESLTVHWLTTADGSQWEPVVPGQPVVLTGGGSETDFLLLADGSLVAVVRNEAGDETGWGSKVCRAEPGALGAWACAADPKKYDSPLMFLHDGQPWLLARRNLTHSGAYDLGYRDLADGEETIQYQTDYWDHPKRCSLWRVDPATLTTSWALDLPSRGDTCFPGVVATDAGYAVYNYSSPLDGPDIDWLTGQLGETHIYRSMLALP